MKSKVKTKYCKTVEQLVAALRAGINARLRLPGYGTLHISHTFRSGILRGAPWAATVANARLSRARGTRDDHGVGGMLDGARAIA